MSTPKKVATRPVKPKVTPPKPTVVVPPSPAVEDAVSLPTSNEVESELLAAVESSVSEMHAVTDEIVPTPPVDTHKRVQTNKAISVNISPARVRRHLDKMNLNLEIDTKIAELKLAAAPHAAALAALNALGEDATDITRATAQDAVDALTPEAAVIASKIAALSRERTRFSNEASITLSIVLDYMIQQLARHTMVCVLDAKMKIIKVCHVHNADVEKLSLAPLFRTLPLFVATRDTINKLAYDSATKAHDANLLAQAEKNFKKKYAITIKTFGNSEVTESTTEVSETAIATDVEVTEGTEVTETTEEVDSKTSFRFYVHQVCKEVSKSDPKFKSIRVSTEIRNYFSDLVVEFIKRVAPLIHETANSMKNKTVSDIAVLKTIENMLIDGHAPHETIELTTGQFTDPTAFKTETAKQAEEKAAGREYKVNVASLPKVDGFIAHRTITYPTSGFAELSERVAEKLALYRKYGESSLEKLEKTE